MIEPSSPQEAARQVGPVVGRLVVLDFDGTLAPIVEHPDDAALAPGARAAVAALTDLTTVAILTGRPVDDVAPRLDGLPVTIVGNHGTAVRTTDGDEHLLLDPERVGRVLDEVEGAVSRRVDPADGWQVERKPTSVALHNRRVVPELVEAVLPGVVEALRAHAQRDPGWKILRGHAVTEFAPSGADKGTALAWLLEHLPADRPVVIGDDVTDEDAFAVAAEHGGVGIVVTSQPRATAATLRLGAPDDVVTTLELLAQSSEIE